MIEACRKDMNLFTTGLVLDTIGKVFIGVAVLMVHRHMSREHRIDRDVLRAMRKEWALTVSGISLIIIGAILQLIFHL
jgi:hypothetical protein